MKLAYILLAIFWLGAVSATTENTTYVNHITTQYLIESSVEKGISSDYMVQSVRCNLFDNKSMLVKIFNQLIPQSFEFNTYSEKI